ncbi:ribosome alternative rescue factor ArfA [Candidatus Pelagibacter bacterium]|nr:ribosome alternative rescue factor ArfA [Candidatus Pelagibacter bacterium]|tara:strand:- start:927 stop:1052 length:126 start_codon:yes stop_codon:yes gene_type:complete
MKDILLNKKNFIAKSLKNLKFRQRVVKPKKGKGSYKRKKAK